MGGDVPRSVCDPQALCEDEDGATDGTECDDDSDCTVTTGFETCVTPTPCGEGLCLGPDGIGDVCDVCPFDTEDDSDGDGICGDVDACPFDPDNDIDGDGICGDVDVCPFDADDDIDLDGQCADVDPCPFDAFDDVDQDGICADVDNCPFVSNVSQSDSDGDGIGDKCDPDNQGGT